MSDTTHSARLRHLALGPTLVLDLLLHHPEAFIFAPGQYTAIRLPDGSALTLSIASSPSRLPQLRLLYKPAPDDPGAAALSELLRTATTLELAAPGGLVRWDLANGAPTLLIGAGTGIAQAFSILEAVADEALERCAQYQLLALAGHASEQIRHPDEERWAAAGLELVRISDPQLGDANTGMAWLTDAAPRLKASEARVLIGGGPLFVYAVHDRLVAAGLDPDRFAADVYEYAPR